MYINKLETSQHETRYRMELNLQSIIDSSYMRITHVGGIYGTEGFGLACEAIRQMSNRAI